MSLKIISLKEPLTDFAKARNKGIQEATQEWVFLIDSDEVVTPESVAELEAVLTTNVEGLMIKRTDVFYVKKVGELYD